jgi:hypothetical protein
MIVRIKARDSVALPAKTFFIMRPAWIAGISSPETKPDPDLKVVRAAWHDGSYDDEAVVPARAERLAEATQHKLGLDRLGPGSRA